MKISVVIGGSMPEAFVIEPEFLKKIWVKTEHNAATIEFTFCGPFSWFIGKQGTALEDTESPWNKGVKVLSFQGDHWLMTVDTTYIPVTVCTDDE